MFMLILLKSTANSVGRFANKSAELTRIFTQSLENRRAIRKLDTYDERMLHDIGLTRSDVSAALDTPFFESPLNGFRNKPYDIVAQPYSDISILSKTVKNTACNQCSTSST
jgi:uncharacterized protein YjiS (DUF1127 family)